MVRQYVNILLNYKKTATNHRRLGTIFASFVSTNRYLTLNIAEQWLKQEKQ